MGEMSNNTNDKFDYKKSLKREIHFNMFKYLNVEKYINRPLASLIVKAVFNTSIMPNQITIISFLIGFVGALLLAEGSFPYIITGGILVQVSSIFDCADGMLARSRGGGTEFGKYLDLFLDRILDFIIILGVVIGIYNTTKKNNILILGLLVIGLYMFQVNLFYINNLLEKKGTGETGELRALGFFILMIFAILNRLDILIYLLFVEVLLNLAYRIFYFLKAGRK